jgi:hypothetical protein
MPIYQTFEAVGVSSCAVVSAEESLMLEFRLENGIRSIYDDALK